MVNSVADGDDFLETLDLDRHDLRRMIETEQRCYKKKRRPERKVKVKTLIDVFTKTF